MRKTMNRLTALALVFALLFTSLPAAFAQQLEAQEPQTSQTSLAPETSDDTENETPQTPENTTETPSESEIPTETPHTPEDTTETPENPEQPDEASQQPDETDGTPDSEEPQQETPEDETAKDESEASDKPEYAGMPQDFALSAQQVEDKKLIADKGILTELSISTADVDYVSREVVLMTDSEEYALQVAAAYNGTLTSFEQGIAVISIAENDDVISVVSAAGDLTNQLPAVYPNYIYTLPDDELDLTKTVEEEESSIFSNSIPQRQDWESYYNSLTNKDPYLNPASAGYQWQHEMLGSYTAWGETVGSTRIRVAVLDTGVLPTHEDLSANLLTSLCKDFTGNANGYTDANGHGTHCCGTVAATINNGKGGAGVAPGVKLIAVKVLSDAGSGTAANISRGINYIAQGRLADVISMSLGGAGYDPTKNTAINNAINKGITVVVSAGNDGSSVANSPAIYDGVITVGSLKRDGYRSEFSTWGAWVSVCAPGSGIVSCGISSDSSYVSMSGTSMACPCVAGAVALFLSARAINYASPCDLSCDGQLNAKDVALIKSALVKAGRTSRSSGIGKQVDAAALVNPLVTAPSSMSIISGSYICDQKYVINSALATAYIDGNNDCIVYTTDGKSPSATYGSVYDPVTGISLAALANGRRTIKAAAINGCGKLSAVKSWTINVKNGVNAVSSVSISGGAPNIAVGKSAKFTASVAPSNATIKDIDWCVSTSSASPYSTTSYASVTTTGTVSVNKNAPANAVFYVYAVSRSDPSKYAKTAISVRVPVASMTAGAGTLNVTRTSSDVDFWLGSSSAHTDIKLFDTAKNELDKSNYTLSITSSNTKVVSVDAQTGKLTALTPGSAVITVKSLDGSNKSAKRTIKVVQGMTSASIDSGAAVCGKTVQLAATVSPANTSNKKLVWSIIGDAGGCTITSSGRLTVPKNPTASAVTVAVTATDGSGTSNSRTVIFTKPITSIRFAQTKYTLCTGEDIGTLSNSMTFDSSNVALVSDTESDSRSSLVYSSSNTKVASVDAHTGVVTALTPGSARITVKSLDGSGKSASCTLTVINPVRTLTLSSGVYRLAKGGSTQINAAVNAFATNKKFTWTVSPSDGGVSISSTGKLSAKTTATEAAYTVRADAKDGSGVYKTITVTVASGLIKSLAAKPSTQTIFTSDSAAEAVKNYVFYPVKTGASANNYYYFTSSNPAVAYVNASGAVSSCNVFSGATPGRAVITAKAADGSNKSCKLTVVVKRSALTVTVNGPDQIAKGKSQTYKASISPANATDKSVTWWVVDSSNNPVTGASISSSGVLRVTSACTLSTVYVTAVCKDGCGVFGQKAVSVTSNNITSLRFTSSDYKAVKNAQGYVTAVNLFTVNLDNSTYGSSNNETAAAVAASFVGGDTDAVSWSSSNPKAVVVSSSGKNATVTSVGTGSATITCTTLDGSNKRASFKVNVTVPAAGVSVGSKRGAGADDPWLAFGKSLQLYATPNSTYGKVSNTKVQWTMEVYKRTDKYNETTGAHVSTTYSPINDYDVWDATIRNTKLSSSGLVSVKNNDEIYEAWYYTADSETSGGYDYYYDLVLKITASSLDGSASKGSCYVALCPATTGLKLYGNNSFRLSDGGMYLGINGNSWAGDYLITSSNPKIANATIAYTNYGPKVAVTATGYGKKGTVTIKITALDNGATASKSVRIV